MLLTRYQVFVFYAPGRYYGIIVYFWTHTCISSGVCVPDQGGVFVFCGHETTIVGQTAAVPSWGTKHFPGIIFWPYYIFSD